MSSSNHGSTASCDLARRSSLGTVQFTFDGREMRAHEGDTIAAAILAAGERCLRVTGRRSEPRGLFCGMGVCFDCLVQVNGRPNVQACRTIVTEGMRVETQHGAGVVEPGT